MVPEVGDYKWPDKYATADKLQLEALGVISLNFNLYEHSLVIFLEERFEKEIAFFLSDKLNNAERATLIRLLMKDDPNVSDEVEYSLRHFSTCMENRHILLHSRLIMPLPDVLALEKFSRGNANKLLEFQLKLGDLRRIADEMHAGFEFVLGMWNFLQRRNQYDSAVALAEEDNSLPRPLLSDCPSLPKRPPIPRKLNPSQSVVL